HCQRFGLPSLFPSAKPVRSPTCSPELLRLHLLRQPCFFFFPSPVRTQPRKPIPCSRIRYPCFSLLIPQPYSLSSPSSPPTSYSLLTTLLPNRNPILPKRSPIS